MSRSKIEWLKNPVTGKQGFTLNPVKGLCPMACPYCYARRMYKRSHWYEEIRYTNECSGELEGQDGDKYFIGSTMELFGTWVKEEWMADIFSYIRHYPRRTFIFLTKNPILLPKYAPYPPNVWLLTSVTNQDDVENRVPFLLDVEAKVHGVSVEPMMGEINLSMFDDDYGNGWFPLEGDLGVEGRGHCKIPQLNWVIVGQQTPPKKSTSPQPQWIDNIAMQCDKASVPVFLKDNLRPLLFPEEKEIGKLWGDKDLKFSLRQEWPKV